jgi:uncharacterized membrane protein
MNLSTTHVVIFTGLAALGCGLMGGLLFAFSNFVMQALYQQSAESGMKTMQSVNLGIQNPIFFVLFFGTTAASLLLAIYAGLNFSKNGSLLLMLASGLFLLGTFGVTVAFNVPLNNGLAERIASTSEAAEFWQTYVPQWQKWNHLRTVTAAAASAIFIWATVVISKSLD